MNINSFNQGIHSFSNEINPNRLLGVSLSSIAVFSANFILLNYSIKIAIVVKNLFHDHFKMKEKPSSALGFSVIPLLIVLGNVGLFQLSKLKDLPLQISPLAFSVLAVAGLTAQVTYIGKYGI